ncbi:MAG: 23S rRNA (pseudouridine(1915)-N(3))-methyltransferase RlmH [Pseudohongiellaceae bacterium]|nr:23S rRNA (pseudouridine(1915)-N(3))-methyltransferase RlmH [Pseudohongiellaceae bacterium]
MKISLICVGTKMPAWVEAGVAEYSKRLPADFALHFIEVPLGKRGKSGDVKSALKKETQAVLAKVKDADHVVALEVTGRSLSTEKLASRFDAIRMEGKNMVLLVGGPDGLGQECRDRANEQWSLSALTLPHPLVRIVLAEQVYRAWSILHAHPYHRA